MGRFCAEKFAATSLEKERGEMPDLEPSSDREDAVPSDEDLEEALKALKKCKAVGMDEAPIEIYQELPATQTALFKFAKRIWQEEDVPEELVLGVFYPLYKKKCVDDMNNYRFICLLSHAYKLLAMYLLKRMMIEIEGFLPECQAGFRAERGCRDWVFVLSMVFDFVMYFDLH